jgi:alpha-galactosidase
VDKPVDITVQSKPRPSLRVVSGNLVYAEQLFEGGLRTRFWSPHGFIKPDADLEPTVAGGELPSLDEPIACSFGLSVDGQELWDGWDWRSAQEVPCERNGCRHVVVELANSIRPIRVKIHTQVDGNPFMKRWLEIINDGPKVSAIGAVYPMSGYLFHAVRLRENLPAGASEAFTVLRPASFDTGREADFRWMSLPEGTYRYGNSKYGLPFAVVGNEVTAESFLIHIGWSGHYAFEFYNDHYPGRDSAALYFRVGLAGPGPFRVLAPGETAVTPSVYIGHTFDSLDGGIQALHKYLRESVLPPLPDHRLPPVEVNSWGFVGQNISEESLRSAIDTAADVGAELFTIDAGWYGDKDSSWWEHAGDWTTGSRLPQGLEPIFDYARKKGLMCGLWVDIERIGTGSELRKKHPDWAVKRHGSSDGQTMLDFTNPEVVKFAEETLAGLIERYHLDTFRLDFNADMGRGGTQDIMDGFEENSSWRHYEALYAMYGRLRKRFPHLMMENCSSGGGRNDLGMLQNFNWAQVSDEWGAVRTLKIINGFTLALPPEYALSYAGFVSGENYRYGDTDFRLRGLMFGHLCLGGVAPDLKSFPADYRARVKHDVDLYKTFIRPILPTALVYHHTPILPNTEPGDWVVLEHVKPDRTRGYAGIFRLAGAHEDYYLFRPRGLDASKTYKVTFDNTQEAVYLSGFDLERNGIRIDIAQQLHSELLLFEEKIKEPM